MHRPTKPLASQTLVQEIHENAAMADENILHERTDDVGRVLHVEADTPIQSSLISDASCDMPRPKDTRVPLKSPDRGDFRCSRSR